MLRRAEQLHDRRAGQVGADDRERSEVEQAVRRVVQTLLHTPTVRVKELTEAPVGLSYADALRELFGLDPAAVEAVTSLTVEDEP